MNLLLLSILLSSKFLNSEASKVRKRRFASVLSLLDQWRGKADQEYAIPESYVFNAVPVAPYDNSDSFQYLGRPNPFLANFLQWDEKYESMGPTLTRILGLAKDILENTDIIQSSVRTNLRGEGEKLDGNFIVM